MLEGSEVVASSMNSDPSSNLSPRQLTIPYRRRLGEEVRTKTFVSVKFQTAQNVASKRL